MIDSPRELLRLLSPYYAANLLVTLAYIPLRHLVLEPDGDAFFRAPGSWSESFSREQEIALFSAFVLFLKSRKVSTVEQLLEKCFLFGKLCTLVLLYFTDVRLMIWYLAAITVMFVGLRQPKYDGEDNIEHLNAVNFKSLVANPQGPDKKVFWLVIFHADWCEKSVSLEPLFAKLSLRYSEPRRRWGKIEVEQAPEIAKEFSINIAGTTRQIPTIILFYKGKELKRLPVFSQKGKVVDNPMSQQAIEDHFGLTLDVATFKDRLRSKLE